MARPESKTVEYFPFYVKDGDTLFLLESKFGCEGLGFFTAVLRFLSQTPDHHYCLQDPVKKMRFFAKAHIDEEKGMKMLELMAVTGKINKVLWDGNQVIVSEDFLNSLGEAYKKRKNAIITIDDIYGIYRLIPEETGFTDTETELSQRKGDGNTQRKVKESKGKEKSDESENLPYKPVSEFQEKADLLSQHLLKLHQKVDEKFKENATWSKDIEKLLRIDKRVFAQVEEVIKWCKQPDNFWFPNIVSGKKLREKYPIILAQMQQERNKGKPPPLRKYKEISQLDICPKCRSQDFTKTIDAARCKKCGTMFEMRNGKWREEK